MSDAPDPYFEHLDMLLAACNRVSQIATFANGGMTGHKLYFHLLKLMGADAIESLYRLGGMVAMERAACGEAAKLFPLPSNMWVDIRDDGNIVLHLVAARGWDDTKAWSHPMVQQAADNDFPVVIHQPEDPSVPAGRTSPEEPEEP